MKTALKTLLFVSIFLPLISLAQTAIYRVNNSPGINADYTTIQAAHDDSTVNSGDILLVEGSGNSYGAVTLTKDLLIFGTGYFLAENDSTQAYTATAKTGEIQVNIGASGTVLSGLEILGKVQLSENAIIERCYIHPEDHGVYLLDPGSSNSIIRQNYIRANGGFKYGIFAEAFVGGIVINNNYIESDNRAIFMTDATNDANVFNNVISEGCDLYNTSFRNNIVTVSLAYTLNFSGATNNVSAGTQFDTTTNQNSVDMNIVFEDYPGTGGFSTDEKWALTSGSPAIGFADDSGDCGIFGGSAPYVLSGMPPIPAIYFYDSPGSGSNTNGLPATIKLMSHN